MKNIYWGLTATLLFSTTSCNNTKSDYKEESPATEIVANKNVDTSKVEIIEKVPELLMDSLVVDLNSNDKYNISYEVKYLFPRTGPEPLVKVLRRKICKMIDANINKYSKAGIEAVGKRYIDESRTEIADIASDMDDYIPTYFYSATVDMTENNDRYITLHCNSYKMTGGAHGNPTDYSTTIDKKGLNALNWDDIFIKDSDKKLLPLLKQNIIKQYYEANDADGSSMNFAKPLLAPALTSKGVLFQFAAYEIDCYAAGMPHCVIPYDEIFDLLTPRTKELIR